MTTTNLPSWLRGQDRAIALAVLELGARYAGPFHCFDDRVYEPVWVHDWRVALHDPDVIAAISITGGGCQFYLGSADPNELPALKEKVRKTIDRAGRPKKSGDRQLSLLD